MNASGHRVTPAVPKVLVVDDDDAILRLIQTALRRSGYHVVVARDGNEAIRCLKEEPFDLVLTDVVMPEMEGLELMTELRRMAPHQKIVAMSGGGDFGTDSYLHYARKLGACGTLSKPFSIELLLGVLRDALSVDVPTGLRERKKINPA
jgi:DNA-binding NtrC family response regulator